MEQSKQWKLNQADVVKWLRNALIFVAPVAVIYLGAVSEGLSDGFSFSDFAVSPAVQGMITLYIVNVLIDLFRKLSAGK